MWTGTNFTMFYKLMNILKTTQPVFNTKFHYSPGRLPLSPNDIQLIGNENKAIVLGNFGLARSEY